MNQNKIELYSVWVWVRMEKHAYFKTYHTPKRKAKSSNSPSVQALGSVVALTASLPLKNGGWKTSLSLLGWLIFRGKLAVKLREGSESLASIFFIFQQPGKPLGGFF